MKAMLMPVSLAGQLLMAYSGQYEVYITAPNFYPYHSMITVQANDMAYI